MFMCSSRSLKRSERSRRCADVICCNGDFAKCEKNTILNEASFLRSMYGLASLVFFWVLESSPIEVHRSSGAVVLSNVFFTSIRCPLFLVSRHFMSIPLLKTHTIFCSAVKTHLVQPTSALLACSGRVSWWWNHFFLGGQVGRKDRDLGRHEPGDLSERP